MKDCQKEDLILYEMPWFAEYISYEPVQAIIGKYIAWKINRKAKRFNARKTQKDMLEKYLPPSLDE